MGLEKQSRHPGSVILEWYYFSGKDEDGYASLSSLVERLKEQCGIEGHQLRSIPRRRVRGTRRPRAQRATETSQRGYRGRDRRRSLERHRQEDWKGKGDPQGETGATSPKMEVNEGEGVTG